MMNTLALSNAVSYSLSIPGSFSSTIFMRLSSMTGPRLQINGSSSALRSLAITSPVVLASAETSEEVQESVRRTLQRGLDPRVAMKLIDTLQRLGISYRYEDEINTWMEKLQLWDAGEDDLHATSLRFRLLRQHAIPVSSENFQKFMVENQGNEEDLLSLYEASYLGARNEDILSKAATFAKIELSKSTAGGMLSQNQTRHINRALELPYHLRMERLESRLYMDEYKQQSHHNALLLRFAKYDYNQVQASYRTELTEVMRWLKQLGLTEKLSFARDRPMECFLWTVGIFPDPKYSGVRIEIAKSIAILLVLDDIFDTYGTMNDLILFTQAIRKWNLDAIEELPEYMKICYMALYNLTNEIAYKVLKEQGRIVLPYLAQTWIDTIDAFMVEAKWFNNGHIPYADEYLENGVTTAGAYMALVFAFFMIGEGITDKNMSLMAKPYPKMFSTSGRILRLWDDLGTAMEEKDRGDNASIITLLMKEKNLASEVEAREHIMQLIWSSWKDLNTELLGTNPLPFSIIKTCLNMSRTSQVIYQHQEETYFSSVDKFVNFILFDPIKM